MRKMTNHCKLLLILSTVLLNIDVSVSSKWSKCSRTCGMGISHRKIACQSDSCTGTEKEYRACNVKDCPAGSIDFRSEQCEKIEPDSVPSVNTSDPCKLMCALPNQQPKDKGAVVDGTPCVSSGVCIDSTCIPVGCDGVLGSDKKFDKCGRCGPTNNGVCLHVSCNLTMVNATGGPEYHAVLPKESTGIRVSLKSTTCYFQALGDESNTTDLTTAGSLNGTEFLLYGDKLIMPGPLTEQNTLQIHCSEVSRIGCRYHVPVYQLNKNVTFDGSSVNRDDLEWVVGYSPCSHTCGRGIKMTEVYCRNYRTGLKVEQHLCDHLPKDELVIHMKACNTQACPFEWKVDSWTPCSKSCGGGRKNRNVACIQLLNVRKPDLIYIGNETDCPVPKPNSTETCKDHLCYAHWHPGTWSECSNPCGDGQKKRNVTCVNAHGRTSDINKCSQIMKMKPREVARCIGDMCTYRWVRLDWSNCSTPCGGGVQNREVFCEHVADNMIVDDDFCLQNTSMSKPKTERSCEGACCTGEWVGDNWGPCEASGCNKEGEQYRNVYCYYDNKIAKEHPNIKCDLSKQPPSVQGCWKTKDCLAEWRPKWSSCSAACIRTANLSCMLGNETVNESECASYKPSTKINCTGDMCRSSSGDDMICPREGCKLFPSCKPDANLCRNFENKIETHFITLCKEHCCKHCKTDSNNNNT